MSVFERPTRFLAVFLAVRPLYLERHSALIDDGPAVVRMRWLRKSAVILVAKELA
jgi:hypothetical protein